MSEQPAPGGTARRAVLIAGGVGAVGAVTGCTVYGGQPAAPAPPPAADPSQAGEQSAGTPLAGTEEVPVGGGLINEEHSVVITQPVAGEFRAFSSACTHQGCPVTEIDDDVIVCRCHDSRFSIEDGSVVQAAQGSGLTPETQDPLAEVGIVVDGDTIAFPA